MGNSCYPAVCVAHLEAADDPAGGEIGPKICFQVWHGVDMNRGLRGRMSHERDPQQAVKAGGISDPYYDEEVSAGSQGREGSAEGI